MIPKPALNLKCNITLIVSGFVNTILSWSPFVPLSRLTYAAYLNHLIVMYVFYFNHTRKFYITNYALVRAIYILFTFVIFLVKINLQLKIAYAEHVFCIATGCVFVVVGLPISGQPGCVLCCCICSVTSL